MSTFDIGSSVWKRTAKKYRVANNGNIFIREIALKDLSIARATADRRKKLLRRASDWFKANYSLIYQDKEAMDFWDEIDDELAKEVTA